VTGINWVALIVLIVIAAITGIIIGAGAIATL